MKIGTDPLSVSAIMQDIAGETLKTSKVSWTELMEKALEECRPNRVHCNVRAEYTATLVEYRSECCVIHFQNRTGGSWDISEMSQEEWENLLARVDAVTGGKKTPIVLLSPKVSEQMAVSESYTQTVMARVDAYVSRVNGASRLLIDRNGKVQNLDAMDGEDYWEARKKRQKEYIESLQEKQMDHALALTRQFAALRGFSQGTDLLGDGLFGGSLAELLLGGGSSLL